MKLSSFVRQSTLTLVLACACSWVSAQDIKAVYHVNTGVDTVSAILGNVRNHLNADPQAKITVVTHGPGIDFLLDGAKDSKGREFSGTISDLASKGVQFRVCNNTLTLSLNQKVENAVKISHRKVFNADVTKEMLGIAKDKLAKYKEMASFLGSKKAKDENIVEYFNRVFPSLGKKEVSRNADRAMEILHTQPGARYAEGSWWQPFNAVTFLVDHLAARNDDNRLSSAWYGQGKNIKTKALETALDFANAA